MNLDGENSPLVTRLDISFDETGRIESLEKETALDQRFRVAILARKGRRVLSPTFGTLVWDRLNSKSLVGRTGSFLAADLQQLVKDLKDLQSAASSRIDLEPIELIDKITKLSVEEIDFGYFRAIVELKTQTSSTTVVVET